MLQRPQFTQKRLDSNIQYVYGRFDLFPTNGTLCTQQKNPDFTKLKSPLIIQPTSKKEIRYIEDKNDLLQRCLIPGLDRRKQVDRGKQESLPYSAILRLELEFDHLYSGSAALVGPCHALTAAHNVYDQRTGKWARSIRIIPFANENNVTLENIHVCHIYKFTDCDLALIILNIPIGEVFGWFGMASYDQPKKLEKKIARVTGYPAQPDKHGYLFTHKGPLEIRQNMKDCVCYDIDTTPGQSGSPLWIKSPTESHIIGIHTHGATLSEKVNQGVLLSRKSLELIVEWIEETFYIQSQLEIAQVFKIFLSNIYSI